MRKGYFYVTEEEINLGNKSGIHHISCNFVFNQQIDKCEFIKTICEALHIDGTDNRINYCYDTHSGTKLSFVKIKEKW